MVGLAPFRFMNRAEHHRVFLPCERLGYELLELLQSNVAVPISRAVRESPREAYIFAVLCQFRAEMHRHNVVAFERSPFLFGKTFNALPNRARFILRKTAHDVTRPRAQRHAEYLHGNRASNQRE